MSRGDLAPDLQMSQASKTLKVVKTATYGPEKIGYIMSSFSVNTNAGAMLALQNLSKTQADLMTTQNRISSGLKVATAQDNGAIFAIAQNQRATSSAYNAVKDSLQRAQSTVDVATTAGQSVSELLIQMKEKALAASDTSLSAAGRSAMNADFTALRDQISKVVTNANFNSINMIKSGGTTVAAIATDTGGKITVAAQDLSLGSTNLSGITAATAISTATLAGTASTSLDTAIEKVSLALSKLGTGSKSLGIHLDFVGKLQDAIDTGVGNMVDANYEREAARLTALQTKQQLGFQALSIANNSTGSLLSLFR